MKALDSQSPPGHRARRRRSRFGRALRGVGFSLASFIAATMLAYALLTVGEVEPTYLLIDRAGNAEDIEQFRASRGYDAGFVTGYLTYLQRLAAPGELGSELGGMSLAATVADGVRTSALAILPGVVIGHLLAIALATLAVIHRGSLLDRFLSGLATLLLSLAGAVLVILVQFALSSTAGLDLLPLRGWRVDSFGAWLEHATAPTTILVLIVLGVSLRYDRLLLLEELGRPHVEAMRCLGASRRRCVLVHALPNAAPVLLARFLLSLPAVFVAGSLMIESYFGIPGMGLLTLDAIQTGDRSFLLFVTGWAALLFVLTQWASDLASERVDPRRQLAT